MGAGILNGIIPGIASPGGGPGGGAFRGALVYPTAAQTVLDAISLSIIFGVAKYDTDNIWEGVTNPDRLTVPTGVTKVKMLGSVRVTGMVTAAHFSVNVNHFNSADVFQERAGMGATNTRGVVSFSNNVTIASAVIDVAAGDYFNLRVFQDSAGNGTTSVGPDEPIWFAMEIIE